MEQVEIEKCGLKPGDDKMKSNLRCFDQVQVWLFVSSNLTELERKHNGRCCFFTGHQRREGD